MGCKCILVFNRYYLSFNCKNVELVIDDILELIEDSIIIKDGKKCKIDCFIYGIGFVIDLCIYFKFFSCIGLNYIEFIDVW